MAIVLTEEQHILIQQYLNLVTSIEEGLDYVTESFSNFEKTEGDQVLADIFDALLVVSNTNEQLNLVFAEEPKVTASIAEFNDFISKLEGAESILANPSEKAELVTNNLQPAFKNWKATIEKSLSAYMN